jgi:chromosome segregation ATPase
LGLQQKKADLSYSVLDDIFFECLSGCIIKINKNRKEEDMKRYNLYNLIFFSLPIMPLLILSLSGCVAKSKYLAQVAETESTKATFQNEMKKNAALNERISTINSILSDSSAEKARLRDEIARLEAERDALKRQVNQISSEVERLNLQLAAATSENGQLKEKIEKLLSDVASITSELIKAREASPVAPATDEAGLQDEVARLQAGREDLKMQEDRSTSETYRLNSELDSSKKEAKPGF